MSDGPSSHQLDQWVKDYRRGQYLQTYDALPRQPEGLSDPFGSSGDSEDSEDVRRARTLWSTLGFVAPRPENEHARIMTIKRMGLLQAQSTETIQRCHRLAMRVVPPDSKVFLSLLSEETQRVLIGPEQGPLSTGSEGDRDASFCGHTMLSREGVDIPDTFKDWRFVNSPFVKDGTIRAYSGLPMRVRRPSGEGFAGEEEYAVGALCVYSDVPRTDGPFIDGETRQVLEDLASIIAREFETQGRYQQQLKEAKMRECSASMLERSAIRGRTPVARSDTVFFDEMATGIGDTLGCTNVLVLDLRASSNFEMEDAGAMSVLGMWSADIDRSGAEEHFRTKTGSIVKRLLEHCQNTEHTHFIYNDRNSLLASPFGPFVRPTTQCFFGQPLFAPDGELMLLLTASSTDRHAYFSESETVFLTALGRIAVSEVLRDRLLQADAAKTAFVARISHELRTPLHGLQSQISLIREVCSPEAMSAIEHHLESADVCAQTLRDIVEDILEFGKITSAMDTESALSLAKAQTRVDLEALMRDLVHICLLRKQQMDQVNREEGHENGDVQMILEIQELPQGCWEVDIDSSGFKRVVLNILSNAIKFCHSGSIRVSMRMIGPDSNALEVVVVDTGVGMSPQFLRDGLFRPFQQEHNFIQGSGLGMNICQGIIKRMSGKLKISSKLGVGTTVSFTLPFRPTLASPVPASVAFRRTEVAVSLPSSPIGGYTSIPARTPVVPTVSRNLMATIPSPPPPAQSQETLPKVSPAPLQVNGLASVGTSSPSRPTSMSPISVDSTLSDDAKLRVLIVDDNTVSRRVLTTVVGRAGVLYQQAVDGLQAFEVFKTFRPQCILTDQSMPVLDGIGSARLMREYEAEQGWARAYIVCISAHPRPATLDPALDEWLVKGKLDVQTTRALVMRMQADLVAATLTATSQLSASPKMNSKDSLSASSTPSDIRAQSPLSLSSS